MKVNYSLRSLGQAPQDTLNSEGGMKVEMNTPKRNPQSTSFHKRTILWKLILKGFHNNYDVASLRGLLVETKQTNEFYLNMLWDNTKPRIQKCLGRNKFSSTRKQCISSQLEKQNNILQSSQLQRENSGIFSSKQKNINFSFLIYFFIRNQFLPLKIDKEWNVQRIWERSESPALTNF